MLVVKSIGMVLRTVINCIPIGYDQ